MTCNVIYVLQYTCNGYEYYNVERICILLVISRGAGPIAGVLTCIMCIYLYVCLHNGCV